MIRSLFIVVFYCYTILANGQNNFSVSFGQTNYAIRQNPLDFVSNTELRAEVGGQTAYDQLTVSFYPYIQNNISARLNLELSGHNADLDIYARSANQASSDFVMGSNHRLSHRLTIGSDGLYQVNKTYLILGFETSFHIPRQESAWVRSEEFNGPWSPMEEEKLKNEIDGLRTVTLGIRLGVMVKPIDRIGLEILTSKQITNGFEEINFNGFSVKPNFKYIAASAKISYFFSLR